ncbi:PREDICTED: fatty acid synthase [Dinoponera quadriceps]|uniref:Fatty acid synthase n=1 Tax=Dinoponera quadriceps TaxID=609295 RepID=A0A6P3XG56_DINQU|nr:PREDICTED: fatty acid synthase [Dinoponera quadriceps]
MSANTSPKRNYKPPKPGDEIVISGIAGRFPESRNVEILKKNLLSKVDMVTGDDRRWKLEHPDIPQRTGKILDVGKFDALFFGVHFKQAHTMDPMCRMLLEHAYEAVIDAGINPKQLRGTRTGVFMGACFSESEKTWFYEKLQVNGFGITGCSRAMMANRVSYWLGVTGPSYTLDSACSSSLYAMEHAFRCIQDGQCDAAIVGGANLCLHPYVSLQFSRLGVLSPDGRSKVFDADADGYARSETISVAFLQKAKDAKRIYARIVYGKTNCDGFKEQSITFPSSRMQGELLRECYQDCGVPPHILSYLECHGTGTKVGDPEEINAIDSVCIKGRTTPLLVGSVKSNLGHSEPASGMCQIAKVITAMETGIIPPNLHFKRPREGVKALEEGRLKVVTEPIPWDGGYVGINSFGFGGANAHILLKSHTKEKINNGLPFDDLPRLVAVSGRTEEAVTIFLDDIEKHPVDVEYIRLLQDIHTEDIQGHLYRGYTIVGSKTAEKPIRELDNYLGTARPIWFVFSGMGSQWPGMGTDLLKFPVFAKAVEKCDAVLRPRGLDIYDILTNKDQSTFDNILNSFVGIAAVQIGLVDLLTSVGIVPDNIIGHSVGELGCAYADGCFTAEQMILSAYSRGLASIETKVIYGSMAAVGMGYEDIRHMCPPDIEVACHNASDSSTISGPAESMKEFVAQLQAKKIFAKEVPCSNIPYHSRYIAPAGPKLLAYLSEVIPQPKPRSRKWMSTSVPRNKWSTASAKLSSAEYHTNNLLSAVLFEETSRLIPKDAVTIEIAPHGLLQAILRRSLGSQVTNIALTQRGHRDNSEVVLQAIGKLYNTGLQPDIAILYPPVEFPVSRGTPMISPSIRWQHSDDWYVTTFKSTKKITSGERIVEVSLKNEDAEYIKGHIIDKKVLLPAIGYLAFVWETLGMLRGEIYSEISIVFENITFLRVTPMPTDNMIELTVMIQKGSGKFEVSEGSSAIVSGQVRVVSNPAQEMMSTQYLPQDDDEEEVMITKDIYKELQLRGYYYENAFRALRSASISGKNGHISWIGNWVTFVDAMMQMMIIGMDTRSLYVPTTIQKLVIDINSHYQAMQDMALEDKQLPVRVYKTLNLIKSSGVEIQGLKATAIPRRPPTSDPIIEEYKFVAYRDEARVSLQEAVRLSTHIALEYHQSIHAKVIEIIDESDNVTVEELMSPVLAAILSDFPLIQMNVLLATPANRFNTLPSNINVIDTKKMAKEENVMLVVGIGLLTRNKNDQLQEILPKLKYGGFVLTRERSFKSEDLTALSKLGLDVILRKNTDKESVILLKKRERRARKTEIVYINNNEFAWLDKLNSIISVENETMSGDTRVILVGEGDESGLLGFVNCFRKEQGGNIIRAVLIQDKNAPQFNLQDPLYAEQLQLQLPVNVLRPGKVWGSYRHLPLPSSLEPKLVHHAFVDQIVRGDLNTLRWIEGPVRSDTTRKDLVYVAYSSINFRDVMLAMGKLTLNTYMMMTNRFDECLIGIDYAGIDTDGRRVMGMRKNRTLSNIVESDKNLCWRVPNNWSLEDAATIPCVYTTCYYALYLCGNMQKGDKVLIHSGTGGVGQAAIHLALHEGCEIFTTVGTPEKREFIHKFFPSIPDDHIGNSRDTSFEQMVMQRTNGAGVDIVLNSLAEEKLQASVRCLAHGGRFLEIGKFDLVANNALGMMVFLKEVSFHGVTLESMLDASKEEKMKLNKLLSEGLANGAVKPLNRKVFDRNNVEAAFRYMAAGKHIGKVILKICDEEKIGKMPILASPRYYCDSKKSYVILGGLGGFGLELADWLVLRGAKNLILISRTGVRNGYQRMRVDLWKSYGVNVLIITGANAANRKDCEFILRSAAKQGPVDAIFNLAVVLKDALCESQTVQSFEESFKPKACSTKMLDELSRKLCPQLQHFVVFSSVSCGRGNVGQTNYGMANSVMERICEKRVADGLPGLAIQWGAVGDVGLLAEQQEGSKELVISGTLQQSISSCLEKLEVFLLRDHAVVASVVIAEKRLAYTAFNIVETVMNIMGVKDLKTVAQHVLLAELGMDSMMAVEIKQTLEYKFDKFFTPQDIRNLTFSKLTEMDKDIAQEKSHIKDDGKAELPGMQLLIQIMGDKDITSDVCLELETKRDYRKVDVFLIAGIEGCGHVFIPLASKIRPTATCLQYGVLNIGYSLTSVPDYADYLLPYILPKVENQRFFVLVGYSYGSIIAIELARRLESRGLSGRLVLVDGAPNLMKTMINQFLSYSTESEFENNILLSISDTLLPTLSGKLLLDLNKYENWEQKVESFLSYFSNVDIPLSMENLKALCTSIYIHLIALRKYDVSSLPPIRTPILLLKPTLQSIEMSEEDYGLRKITRDKVEIHYTEGNHVTMLNSDKVVAAINGDSMLDSKTFKKLLMEDKPLEEERIRN